MIKKIIISHIHRLACFGSGYSNYRGKPIIKMAAKEVRRYTYLRTEQIPNFKYDIKKSDQAIIVGTHNAVAIGNSQEYTCSKGGFIKSIDSKYGKVILISGDTEFSTLYAAYRFANTLGADFTYMEMLFQIKKLI